MPAITVTPLAFESLGVRSMCTLVKTRDVAVLLDAGVALGPRFSLIPHPQEYQARDEARKRIEDAAVGAKVVTISHYHNDHHTPNYVDPVWLGSSPQSMERIYKGKIILAKDSRRKINTAQRRRGWMFRQTVEKLAERFEAVDGHSFEFGRTTLRFPAPVPHGENESGLGWVLPCVIERSKDKIVFAPDIQGPVVKETLDFLLEEKPQLLIIGGPPTYLRGFKVGDEFFETAIRNMQRLSENISTIVIDHHLLRDEAWYDFLAPVRRSAEKAGNTILTAADLLKARVTVLECRRKQLYEVAKPGADFMKWANLPEEKRNLLPPPRDETSASEING